MSSKLLPCPFCRSEASALTDNHGGTPPAVWIVACRKRGCGAEVGFFPSKEEAIAAWNHRTPGATGDSLEALDALERLAHKAIEHAGLFGSGAVLQMTRDDATTVRTALSGTPTGGTEEERDDG